MLTFCKSIAIDHLAYLLVCLSLFVACREASDVAPAKIDDRSVTIGHFRLAVPEAWTEVATTALVEFSPQQAPDYRIVGYRLPSQKAMQEAVAENIEKWEKVFSELATKQSLGLSPPREATYLVGTARRNMHEDGPKVQSDNYAVLLGYLPAKSGCYCFVLEGPRDIVEPQVASFRQFLDSSEKTQGYHPDVAHEIPATHPLEAQEQTATSADGKVLQYSDFQLMVPEEWKVVESSSPMRLVELELRDNPQYKVVGYHFGSLGISHEEAVKRNLARWGGQFSKLDEKRTVPLDAQKVVLVHFTGTYVDKPPMASEGVEKENYGMLASVLPSADGPYYFRLVAPRDIVAQHIEPFEHFLNSYAKRRKGSGGETNSIAYANFRMNIPTAWEKKPKAAPMRLVEFSLKQSPGHAVVGYYFGPTQMSKEQMVAQNITRWKGQFSKLESERRIDLDVSDVVLVELSGIFLKKARPMAPKGTPTPGYSMLAAIVPSSQGPYYFRLIAPREVVAKEMDNFTAFLNSYTTK